MSQSKGGLTFLSIGTACFPCPLCQLVATVHYDVEYSEAKSRYLAVNVVVQAMDQNPQTAPNDESGVAPNPVRGQR